MKKIILIIFLFIITGCYDYHEINEISIITGIGIDYIDNNYVVTLETLNENTEKESGNIKSIVLTSKGKTLTEAIDNTANILSNKPIYSHIGIMVLSKNILENKTTDLIDFFLRSIEFRENFFVVSSLDDKPFDIFNNTNEHNLVISTTIKNLLENNKYTLNNSIEKTFLDFSKELTTFGIDTIISSVKKDDDNIIIDGAAIFNDKKYSTYISNEDVMILNIIKEKIYNPTFTTNINNKDFTINLTNGKTNYNIKDNELNIYINLNAQIVNNNANIDIKNINNIDYINKQFKNDIYKKINNLITKLKQNKSDLLGIDLILYQNLRKKEKNKWLDMNIKINIDFNINKKGLLFEVNYE